MKFVDTKRFSPIIYENDVPHPRDLYWQNPKIIPKTKREFVRFCKRKSIIIDKPWWDRQRQRCMNGYSVEEACVWEGGDVFVDGWNMDVNDDGSRYIRNLKITIPSDRTISITEKHYFYLNLWKIIREDRQLERKILGNPDFSDLSFENWWVRKRMFLEKLDNLWAKCRQIGLSEESACDLAYALFFYDDVQLAIVGGEDIYNENTMKMLKRGLKSMYNTQFYKELAVDKADMMITEYTGAEVYSRTANNNPQVLSGLTPYSTKLEEIGIMKEKLCTEIAEFVKPSLKAGGRKLGFIDYIGTSGVMEDGVFDIERMIYNPKAHDILEFEDLFSREPDHNKMTGYFIPAWKFEIVDEDGNSLKEESIKQIKADIAKKEKHEQAIAKASKPIHLEDMFDLQGGGFFGDVITSWCNETRSRIVKNKKHQVIERGFLHWKNKKQPLLGCDWEPDERNGDILVFEHPERDELDQPIPGLYCVGTDSYDQDEAKTSSSKLACSVYKTYNYTKPFEENVVSNEFVGLYLDRPTVAHGGREVAYEKTAQMAVYFGAYNLIEYSNLLIFQWYEDNGLAGYLKERPDLVIANMVEKSNVSNKFGFPKNLVPYGLKMLRDWASDEDNVRRCKWTERLHAWAQYKIDPNYNCDITISDMLCIVSAENDKLGIMSSQKKKRPRKRLRGYKEVNGVLTQIYTAS